MGNTHCTSIFLGATRGPNLYFSSKDFRGSFCFIKGYCTQAAVRFLSGLVFFPQSWCLQSVIHQVAESDMNEWLTHTYTHTHTHTHTPINFTRAGVIGSCPVFYIVQCPTWSMLMALCVAKETINKMKSQPTRREKIFAYYISDRG